MSWGIGQRPDISTQARLCASARRVDSCAPLRLAHSAISQSQKKHNGYRNLSCRSTLPGPRPYRLAISSYQSANSTSYQSAYIPTYRPISRGIYEPTNLPIGLSLSRLRLSALGIYQPINLTARHSIDSESTYLTIDLLPYDL